MLLIYLPATTNRTEYVFKLIFKDELGIDYQVTADIKKFELYEEEKINYSAKRVSNEIFIKASSILFENALKKTDILIQKKYNTIVLFSNEALCDVGFDIFSAVFYMVSRYEEYLSFASDKYGRFKASTSLAYQNKFLEYPVVDIWIRHLKEVLLKKYPSLKFKSAVFSTILTYDIDVAFAYKGRGVFRQIGATVKDAVLLKFNKIFERLLTFVNLQKDPWDIYDFLHNVIKEKRINSVFFFLLADPSRHDKNLNYRQRLVKELVNKISEFSEIGIHPSYKSSVLPEKISTEKKRLENLANKKIFKSRQHYLKFTLPETYNHLTEAGITEDYSMGFADLPGFRAGTCSPFYFYDLKNERPTELKIFPVTCMDGTFMDYMQLSPEDALQHIYKLIQQVKDVNGTFISIWHNHTVSETNRYKDWRNVHNKMIERILLNI